jgi:hypothetical protein
MTSYTFDQLLDFTRTTSGTFVGSNGLIQTTPASANLLTQTQQFYNSIWVAFGTKTVTANTVTSPDGTVTADTLSSPAGNGIAQQNLAISASTAYTASVYVKATTGTQVRLQMVSSGGTGASTDQLLTISSGTNVGNGWYRLAINLTSAAGDNQLQMRLLTFQPVLTEKNVNAPQTLSLGILVLTWETDN